MTPKEVIDFAKENGAKMVDLKFMDFPGLWQHFSVPISELSEALDALEANHEFLLKGDVFTEDVIETWLDFKRTVEVDELRLRPHPIEFALYFDC